jgi:two-component system sensor histidine kinase KdpD
LQSTQSNSDLAGYALALVGAAAAVVAAALAERWVGLDDLSLVFMLAVLLVATRTHTGPAIATAVLCFLAYNYFFIEPRYTFYISAHHGVATVALFLAAAMLAGRLASRLAMQVQALRIAGEHASARQDLAQRLTVAASEDDVVQAAHAVFGDSLGAGVWVRLGARGLHAPGGETPEHSVLRRIADDRHVETVEEHGWWFLPLRAPDRVLGVIGLKLPATRQSLDEGQRQLARTMADDVAQALLRTHLVADLQTERVAGETERLRSALLSSVSHDLRTPLAGIIGAAETLDTYGAQMDEADRHSLLDTVRDEGQRLDRHIQNLLDMTRLGQGGLVLRRDWIGIDELIGSAVARLQRSRPRAQFRVWLEGDIAPLWVQPALVEQALFNVIENAARFSPADEAITLRAQLDGDAMLRIDIADRGPGIPEAERERVFDMFYSVGRGDRASGDASRDGTGLGLAICRGMIRAHGGDVEALSGDEGRGTTIRIHLPLVQPDAGAHP